MNTTVCRRGGAGFEGSTTNIMEHWLIGYTEVRELLREVGGLRKREAETLLARRCIPTVPHTLHTRQRWQRQVVLDFIKHLPQRLESLGKDAPGAVTPKIVNRKHPHVPTR